jgi:hypothetical protein
VRHGGDIAHPDADDVAGLESEGENGGGTREHEEVGGVVGDLPLFINCC